MKNLSLTEQQRIRQFWDGVADDLELLARLNAFELNESVVQSLVKGGFPETLYFDPKSEHSIRPVMKKSLTEIVNGDVTQDQLAADFAAIYLNGAFGVSPNESAWLDEDHLERQEPMFEVRNWYTKYGLKNENWRRCPDDNISLQLLFIAHLIRQQSICIKDIGHFMDFHILRWVEEFAEKVFQRVDTAFYACLGLLTSQYLLALRDLVADEEGKPKLSKKEVEEMTAKVKPIEVFDPLYYSSHDGGW